MKTKKKNASGYYMIYKPEHPKADKGGYVREHIVIAEKKIGRYFRK